MGVQVLHTTPLTGVTVSMDKDLLDLSAKIQTGDGVSGWSGDYRMFVTYNYVTGRYEIQRLTENGQIVLVLSKPHNEFDSRVLTELAEGDTWKRDVLAEIDKANAKVEAANRAEEEDFEAELLDRLEYVERKAVSGSDEYTKKEAEWMTKELQVGTRADIRNECENRIEDNDNVIASDATVNGWINKAVAEISRAHHWPFLKVRASLNFAKDVATADLPAACRGITKAMLVLPDGTRSPLTPVPDRWLQNNTEPSGRGSPSYYTDGGYKQSSLTSAPVRVLRIAPTPDQAVTVDITYLRRGEKLTADEHYPPFPEEFDELITLWVMRQYWRQIMLDTEAQTHDKAYKDELTVLKSQFGREFEERLPRIMLDFDDEEAY